MVEAQPGPSSVLLSSCLGRTFSLPDARLSVTSTTSLNHLSPPNDASPAFLHLNIREISFLEAGRLDGKRACKSQNHEQLKSRKGIPPALQTKEEETRGCVVCKSASDVFLALAISLQTTLGRANGSMCCCCCYTGLHDPPPLFP